MANDPQADLEEIAHILGCQVDEAVEAVRLLNRVARQFNEERGALQRRLDRMRFSVVKALLVIKHSV